MNALLHASIESHLDLDRVARVRKVEARDRRQLLAALHVAQRQVSR